MTGFFNSPYILSSYVCIVQVLSDSTVCICFIHFVCCACCREAMGHETDRCDYGTSPARSLSGFGCALPFICWEFIGFLIHHTFCQTTKPDRHLPPSIPEGPGSQHHTLRRFICWELFGGVGQPFSPRTLLHFHLPFGRGPTQGTCRQELTAERLLPPIRMRMRICFCIFI